MVGERKCTKRQMLSLLGHLNFACRVVVPERPFVRRLIEVTKSVPKLHHSVYLTDECREDIFM
jgi:hypothetical protein